MAMTNTILAEVAAYLKEVMPSYSVDLHPGKLDMKTYHLSHPIGTLLVSYQESEYDTTSDMSMIAQRRLFKAKITIIARKLNGPDGTNDIVDKVGRALLGFTAVDCEPAWLVKDQFIEESNGLWHHEIDFQVVTLCHTGQIDELNLLTEVEVTYEYE